MRGPLKLSVAALAVATSLACGSGEPAATQAPAETPPVADPTAPAEKPAAAPKPAPPAASGGDAAAGAQSYALYCASCHGATGNADGPIAAGLDPKPARHTDGATMNALTDDYLFRVIKDGGAAVGKSPLMAPWGGTLSDAQIRDVVAFVRSLADPPYSGG